LQRKTRTPRFVTANYRARFQKTFK
jgi:hypothetical protein